MPRKLTAKDFSLKVRVTAGQEGNSQPFPFPPPDLCFPASQVQPSACCSKLSYHCILEAEGGWDKESYGFTQASTRREIKTSLLLSTSLPGGLWYWCLRASWMWFTYVHLGNVVFIFVELNGGKKNYRQLKFAGIERKRKQTGVLCTRRHSVVWTSWFIRLVN